jgi:pilus assembly protein TadC
VELAEAYASWGKLWMYDWCRDVIALRKYIYITKILIYIFFEYFYIKIKKKSKIIKKKKN